MSKVAEQMLKRCPYGQLGTSRAVVDLVVDACDPKEQAAPDPALERWLDVG